MTRFAVSVLLAVAGASVGTAVEVPAGTEIQIRLQTNLASNRSKANDPVEAITIEPVIIDGRIIVPGGVKVIGQVKDARAASQGDRALLDLSFTSLEAGKSRISMAARLSSVDNARESVDANNGQILGIVPSETYSSRIDQGIAKLQQKYAGLADVLQTAKSAIVKESDADIVYDAGVEMTIRLTASLAVSGDLQAEVAGPKLEPVPDGDGIVALVNAQPFQTRAEKPPAPSDITNILFAATEQQLTEALTAAGWSTATALTSESKLETARALIEDRGYKEAPVSVLMLDGRPPELVFQKQNDTFAQRHHMRVWRRPVTYHGKPVWVCAATHDTGISFSEQNRTFIHKVDSKIDRERAKVVNDLLLTGKVKSLELVQRDGVPRYSRNATGDDIETDAAMAVLIF